MADPWAKFTDAEADAYAAKIGRVYKKAAKELKAKLKDFNAKFAAKSAAKKAQVAAGEITKQDYQDWLAGQVFQRKEWQQKIDDATKTYVEADKEARQLLQGTLRRVFSEAANHAAYEIEQGTEGAVNFSLYDAHSVDRIIRKNPQMLPKWKVDEPKDYKWNAQRVRSAIVQGIIQGESVPDITRRMTGELAASNARHMELFARTAMTGAQNAGRIARMHEATDLGIHVQKQWNASLDSRTRDTHAALDGQVREPDEPFEIAGQKIDFPGDPTARPDLVYNCRCYLTYVYPEYADLQHGPRHVQETGEDIADMTYSEWQQAKESGLLSDYSAAKAQLFDKQKQVFLADADHVFSGIWKNDVTYADYYDKMSGLIPKMQYFNDQIAKAVANGDTASEAKFRHLKAELDLFIQKGPQNFALLMERDAAQTNVKNLAAQFKPPKPKRQPISPFGADAYSQARKDAALWAKSVQEADKALRDEAGQVWRDATAREKAAIYEYTLSYHKFNEPLRGIEYGTNRYLGVGNTDLNAGYANNGDRLNAMTDIIEKSHYDRDVWLQRGCGYGGMDKFFQASMSLLQNGSESELQKELLGREVTEYAFMSCGSAKGRGFSTHPIIMNIYCPKGTKMMYVEPFSHYGAEMHQSGWGEGLKWDGKKTQSSFGTELETILQQGTRCRVTKVERRGGGTIYVDLEVIAQDLPQRWTK